MIIPVEIVPGTTATVYVAGVKLERGSQATDWTPAPEDTTAEISHSVSSALTVYDDQIKGEINDKYQIKGDYPTTGQMNTAISQSRIAIESSVADTYYTKSDADDLSDTLSYTSTLVTQTKNAIDTTFTNTIVDNSIAYAVSSKSTSVNSKTPPDDVKDSDWGTEIKWESGKYTWQRTTVTKANVKYDDSKKAYVSNPETVKTYVCIQGAAGEKGDKGDNGVSPTVTASQENGVTRITVTDVNGSNTYEVKDGTDGTSVEVSSTTITYQAGASGTAAPTGTWYDTVEKANAQKGQYLWTKTVVTYSDGKNSESYSVSYIANDGVNGTSIGIKSKSVTYQQGDNGTTAPTGEWLQSIPNVPAGKFL